MVGMLRRPGWMNAACAALAMLLGAPSLWFPLGRDQGLFFYVAREWMLRGQLLYRDVWDHKPPLVYLIYMASMGLFGVHPWAIRIVEFLIGVPLLAFFASRLAQVEGEAPPPGLFGACWLGAALSYYGYFNFWDTAQCEMWSALFATMGIANALRGRDARRGAALGGALSAAALFTKPPVVFFVITCLGAVVWRARAAEDPRRNVIRNVLGWAAGGAAVSAFVLGYFAARRALAPMLDILVGANSVYLANERSFDSLLGTFIATTDRLASLEPFAAVFVLVCAGAPFVGYATGDRALAGRYVLPASLALSSWGAVALQQKFYDYHWGTILAAGAVFAGTLYTDITRLAARRENRVFAPVVFLTLATVFYVGSGPPFRAWANTAARTVGYLGGDLSPGEFARTFDIPFFYSNYDADLTGRWLREHASPGDTLVVRGFEPEIYATSGLHFTGRFFWTSFLTMSTRVYRRDEYLREDYEAILKEPPRFAVTLAGATDGVDSPVWFERSGYVRRVQVGYFVVLERGP
jgi:hypothetical protein